MEPFLPYLYWQTRQRLLQEARQHPATPLLLDIGGRKSPYTIGVPARVTVIDLPRESDIQKSLNLGVNDEIVAELRRRRSNIERFILGDMTNSDLPDEGYHLAVSVEVLEHVDDDEKFVSEVSRVLKPGGRFIMTTPNGDYVPNKNPDHRRHYKRTELKQLLDRHFDAVIVEYAIAGGYFRKVGLRSWSIRAPFQTALCAFGNVVNSARSARPRIAERAIGTHHLFAVAVKN